MNYCNNKECDHCKDGVCRNRKVKLTSDCPICKWCSCMVEDYPTVKELVEDGLMTIERCEECNRVIKSYRTEALPPKYERLINYIEERRLQNIEKRKEFEERNDHVKAIENKGEEKLIVDLCFLIEGMEGVQ